MKIKSFIGVIIVILAVVIIAVITFYPKDENGYTSYHIDEAEHYKFYGNWINVSTNESPEFPLSWYTFCPNGICYSPMGEMYWDIDIYQVKNVTDRILRLDMYKDHNLTFCDVYDPYNFSNNNKTLRLQRTVFGCGSNENWKFTNRTYYKLNETLSVEEVIQNFDLYLAKYSLNESKWFGLNLTVEGYYYSASKGLVSSPVSSYMLKIHVDNFSLLRDGVKYNCKGILREFYETPINGDFILDVEEITIV